MSFLSGARLVAGFLIFCGSLSVGFPITCLGFSLPVEGHFS